MTESQLLLIGHTLGINVLHAKLSKKKKDKKLPKEFFRNRFCAGENHDDMLVLLSLESAEYMSRGTKINQGRDTLWYVTEAGIKAFREQFNLSVNIKPLFNLRMQIIYEKIDNPYKQIGELNILSREIDTYNINPELSNMVANLVLSINQGGEASNKKDIDEYFTQMKQKIGHYLASL